MQRGIEPGRVQSWHCAIFATASRQQVFVPPNTERQRHDAAETDSGFYKASPARYRGHRGGHRAKGRKRENCWPICACALHGGENQPQGGATPPLPTSTRHRRRPGNCASTAQRTCGSRSGSSEGLPLGDAGETALITICVRIPRASRTTRCRDQAYIVEQYGKDYVAASLAKSSARGAQGGHEGFDRPRHRSADTLKGHIGPVNKPSLYT